MIRRLQSAWTIMAFAGMILITTVGADVFAAPTVKGDAAAWNDIVAAYRRLFALSGYRVRITSPDGRTAIEEAAPPNFHWSVTMPQGSADSYLVGGVYAAKRGGRCVRVQTRRPNFPDVDLSNYKGTVRVGRKPDTRIDGTLVHDYTFALVSPGGSESHGDIYIGAQTGLPRRVLNITDGRQREGAQPNVIDYYDYGAKITIALPC